MNTDVTWQTDSSNSADTFAAAERLGQKCKGGEIFLLKSDIGGGKTTFVKGLAKGLGSKDVVNSPTFMVERVYACRNGLLLHHYDFYRLQEAGILARELSEVINDNKAVIAVEWGDIVSGVLPIEHIEVTIERKADSEDARAITVNYPEKFNYLFKDIS